MGTISLSKKILITGCAGFIGSNLVDNLLEKGYKIVGIDNFNDYYSPEIKKNNLESAIKSEGFVLYKEDILNFEKLKKIFSREKVGKIIHLAARAGVRPSIKNPLLYSKVNVLGTINLLKLAVDFDVEQFILGSSSSVYGLSKNIPFIEEDFCVNIISPYAASKRSAEFLVESFCHSYKLKSTILRFFTVYGPRGRPDMAPAIFTKAIESGQTLKQFGNGSSSRDFTYIDDIIDGIVRCLDKTFEFEIINLGNNHSVSLLNFISTIETVTGKQAKIQNLPKQPGDVEKTWANVVKARELLGWRPKVDLETGLTLYLRWLKKQKLSQDV